MFSMFMVFAISCQRPCFDPKSPVVLDPMTWKLNAQMALNTVSSFIDSLCCDLEVGCVYALVVQWRDVVKVGDISSGESFYGGKPSRSLSKTGAGILPYFMTISIELCKFDVNVFGIFGYRWIKLATLENVYSFARFFAERLFHFYIIFTIDVLEKDKN